MSNHLLASQRAMDLIRQDVSRHFSGVAIALDRVRVSDGRGRETLSWLGTAKYSCFLGSVRQTDENSNGLVQTRVDTEVRLPWDAELNESGRIWIDGNVYEVLSINDRPTYDLVTIAQVRHLPEGEGLPVCHVQTFGKAVWTLSHGLGRAVTVSAHDDAGNALGGSVAVTDANTSTITFAGFQSGFATVQ